MTEQELDQLRLAALPWTVGRYSRRRQYLDTAARPAPRRRDTGTGWPR